MPDGNMARSNVKDHFWNEKGIITRNAIAFSKIPNFFLECIDSTDAAGKYNTYAVAVNIIMRNTCIRNGLITGTQGGLSKTIQLAGFFFIKKTERIDSFSAHRQNGF